MVSVSIFTSSTIPTYSTPSGHVHKFCILTLTDVWLVPAYSISVGYVYKWPGLPTHEGVLGEESTGNDERLTREYDLLRSFGDL